MKKPIVLFALCLIPISISINKVPKVHKTKVTIVKTYDDFVKDMIHQESRGIWDTVNAQGYIGLFQIGESALDCIGMKEVTVDSFKSNPNIFPKSKQKLAFKRLVRINTKILIDYINKYEGTFKNNVKITKSGLIAAAHLAGAGNVMRYFDEGYNAKDINKKSVANYIEQFAGYTF